MIIVFGGEKGGTGKTTLATNIAIARAMDKKESSVLLVDSDPQSSANEWNDLRNTEVIEPTITTFQKTGSVKKEILSIRDKFDDIIIDTGGRDSKELRSSMVIADKLIIPIQANQFDIWSIGKMFNLLSEMEDINEKLETLLVVNRVHTNIKVKSGEEAISFLKEELKDNKKIYNKDKIKILEKSIGDRRAYQKLSTVGQGIYDSPDLDKKAFEEIKNLYIEIYGG